MIIKPKGTYDLIKEKGQTFKYIENVINNLMDSFNYEYIKTPLIENSNLFHRGVGETTDIVTKETYDFKDRGDRSLTLRPEGTAGVVRSYIENKMYANNGITKLWYLGNMYRYERPQSGRYREFMQYGCEVLGSDSPALDAEIISIPVTLFEILGLKGVKVKVNTLGDVTSRENYKKALLDYFKPHLDELCEDCKERFSKNPLRILDCKVDKENDIIKNAPKTIDYLTEESQKHFDEVLKALENLDIDYEIDTNVIRGLDYYTHTVFEIEANVEGFGAQNVMCGGGRYNNLVKSLDGPDIPAVGFAIGIERLMKALEYENINTNENSGIDTFVIPVGEEAKGFALSLNHALRLVGIKSDTDYLNKNIKNNLKQAENFNAKFALILGEEEIKNKQINVRNMKTKEEQTIKHENIIIYLAKNLESLEEHKCSCDSDDDCDCGDDCNCDHNNSCSGNCSHHE